MTYVEIDNRYEKNESSQAFILITTLMLILSVFTYSLVKNYNFFLSDDDNDEQYIREIESIQNKIPFSEANNKSIEVSLPEYHAIEDSTEVLMRGRLKDCLDKLILDGAIEKDNANQIQNVINSFYEVSQLKDSTAEINLDLNSSINRNSIKKMMLKIDDLRYLQIVNDNNIYKIEKIFQHKRDESSQNNGFTDSSDQLLGYQEISNKNGELNSVSTSGYSVSTKNIKLNESNIKLLSNVPLQQLVVRNKANNRRKQDLKFTTLTKHGEVVFFLISNGNKSLKYYGKKDKRGMMKYYTKNGVSAHSVSNFGFPITSDYKINSPFGMRVHPILFYKKMHTGIDVKVKHGTPIYAPYEGKIEFIGVRRGYGKYIIVKHNNRYKTAYGHLSAYGSGLRVGSLVKKGQMIGRVGATGMASGAHLHYEVIDGGKFINPLSIKMNQSIKLDKKEMISFTQSVHNIDKIFHKLETINKNIL